MKSLFKAEFSGGLFLLNTAIDVEEKYLNIWTGILSTSAQVEVSNCCASLDESVQLHLGTLRIASRGRALCILAYTWCLDLVKLQMKLLSALGLIMWAFCNWPVKKKNPQEVFKACSCGILAIYKIVVFFCYFIIAGNWKIFIYQVCLCIM